MTAKYKRGCGTKTVGCGCDSMTMQQVKNEEEKRLGLRRKKNWLEKRAEQKRGINFQVRVLQRAKMQRERKK